MDRLRDARRVLLLLVSAIGVAGCGTAGMLAAPPVAHVTSTPSPPAPAAAAAPPSAPATLSPAPSAPPTPTPAPQQPAGMTFAIAPLFPGGAAGSVTAVSSPNGVHYDVVVTGLVANSGHTIHDHAGRCGAANGSAHLDTLTTATADASGVIAFQTTVPPSDFGAGRIVIVYDSARPLLITGCATL